LLKGNSNVNGSQTNPTHVAHTHTQKHTHTHSESGPRSRP